VVAADAEGSVTVASPATDSDDVPTLFVIMPFVERDDRHDTGFFEEVLNELFTPAGTAAGFKVKTAKRQGSDVIQATIVNELLEADLVLADLTEHNPNVLFELGMRMNADLPVVLVRARGTRPIFDVDNMLRVEEYSPNLWGSKVKDDIPVLTDHIKAAWNDRETRHYLYEASPARAGVDCSVCCLGADERGAASRQRGSKSRLIFRLRPATSTRLGDDAWCQHVEFRIAAPANSVV
jgi:hypothetical protein